MKRGTDGEGGAESTSFWVRQVPWLGVTGYLLTPVNIINAWEAVYGVDVLDWFQAIWTFEMFWAVTAGCLLMTRVDRPSHRKFRLGLAMGFATWVAPFVLIAFFHMVHPLGSRP